VQEKITKHMLLHWWSDLARCMFLNYLACMAYDARLGIEDQSSTVRIVLYLVKSVEFNPPVDSSSMA
jgi:hypothetical protein